MKRKSKEVVYSPPAAFSEPYDTENDYALTLTVRVGFYGHDKQAADVLRVATDVMNSTFDDVEIIGSDPEPNLRPKVFVR